MQRNSAPGASVRPIVLFVVNSLEGGGAERMMVELTVAAQTYSTSHDIRLVLLDDLPRAYDVPAGITVHQLDARRSLLRSGLQFFRLAQAMRPVVTLSFLSRSNFVTVMAGKWLGHPTVISERVNTSGHFVRGIGAAISRWLVRVCYPRADHVVTVSDGIRQDLIDNYGVSPDRITTVANPVNRARILAASEEQVASLVATPYAVAVSRLSPNKNAILAVEALALSRSGLSLLILGEGPERPAIESRIVALGLQDRVVMPGFVGNPYPYIRAAECYISGSNAEGFPNGLVEALTLGTPSISTNCPSGPSEILADRPREDITGTLQTDIGILVPQNDPAAMAAAIDEIVRPEVSHRFRASGPVRAGHYSLEAARDRYWEIIARMASATGRWS